MRGAPCWTSLWWSTERNHERFIYDIPQFVDAIVAQLI